MALSTVTVTFDLHQLLGDDFDARRTRAYVKTNVANGTLMDTSTGEIRLGDQKVTIGDDGTGSFTTWAPGVDGNPTSWQTSLVVEYPRTGQRDRAVRTFGPYTITATADLADLEEEQAVPAEYLTIVTALLDGYVDQAEAHADDAAESADAAQDSAGQALTYRNQAAEIALGDAEAAVAAYFADGRTVRLTDHGASFDRRSATLTTAAGTTALTGTGFTADDVSKVVFIPGAGPAGTPFYGTLITTIASVTSGTAAVLSDAATATVTDASGYIGTNNDPAWDAAFAELGSEGGTIVLPWGHGIHATQKEIPNNVRVVGAGRDLSFVHPLGSVSGFNRRSEVGAADPDLILNVHFRDFTVDGDMQTNGDGAGAKGFNLSYLDGCTFTDVAVRNTAGSGFGNDVQIDTIYSRCIAENCGRIGTTSSPGHSGFGFGTGAYATENVYVLNCISRDNMRHGLFLENQPLAGVEGPNAAGIQVIGGRFEGNGVTGISDQSGRGLVVIGAHIVNNDADGYSVTTTAAVDQVGIDGLVADCVITGNGGNGMDLAYTHTPLPETGFYRVLNNLVASNGGQGIQVRTATGVTTPAVEVANNICRRNTKNGIRFAGGTFTRCRIAQNTCTDNGLGSDEAGGGLTGSDRAGISIQTDLVDSEVTLNVCRDSRSSGKSQAYGIFIPTSGTIGTVTGNSRIANNELRGNATAALSSIGQVSGSARVRSNEGLTFGTVAGVPSPVSGTPVTCGVRPEQHFIAGGTVTQIAVNGVNLLASGSVSAITEITLQPADTLAVTWSSAPAWKYRTL